MSFLGQRFLLSHRFVLMTHRDIFFFCYQVHHERSPSLIFHLFTTTPGAPGFYLVSVQMPVSCKPQNSPPPKTTLHLLIIPHASLFAVLPLTDLDVTAVNDSKGFISESQSRVTSCRILVRCNPPFHPRKASIVARKRCGR